MKSKLWSLLFVLIILTTPVSGGPGLFVACEASCTTALVACIATGTYMTMGIGVAAAVAACEAGFAECSAVCALLIPVPTP